MYAGINLEADRAFFRDVLGFSLRRRKTSAARRKAAAGILPALMKSMQAKGVICFPVETEAWGTKTTIQLPRGGEVGIYQPTHPTALGLT
jgi:catechol 2,3-dioxygenase-like lactoylglutathione lyase family enzyme